MLLVVAALEEELKAAIELCGRRRRISRRGLCLWQAERGGALIGFLKAGVGPKRSAASLGSALEAFQPSSILAVGYAGALDPDLKLGDIVAVERAIAFSLDRDHPSWESVRMDGSFALAHFERHAEYARSSGLRVKTGDALTSSYVVGNPEHKKILSDRFGALIVDMETAAFARVAAASGIPLSCVRVVSDEAADTFLAPLSFDPATPVLARARKMVGKGTVKIYREWKKRTAVARKNLSRFLERSLQP
jgi:adenosylhomocysteine nucleosidase